LLSYKTIQQEKLHQKGRCSECGSGEFITDPETGEVICSQCGLVLQDEALDQGPEWRAFTPQERDAKLRVGSPSSLKKFDKGLSTTFHPYKDAFGKTLPAKKRIQMMRLRKWHIRARVHSSAERNLSKALSELTRISDKLHIPKEIEEEAALIYRKALDKGLVRGRSIKSIAAASLYAACRFTRTPRSLKEVVDASGRGRKEVARCYRLIQRNLDLKMPIDNPTKYISKIASKTGLSQKTQNMAIELIHKAEKKNDVVGKGPAGMAAAALYIASIIRSEKVTQKELAEAAEVTEVTVRNRFKGLDKCLELGIKKILRKPRHSSSS
jgi:transcription initiation factor TFIIB